MIPDEAVEAAARALCEADTDGGLIHPIAAYMDHARAALEAAAPHMLRDALACGWDAAIAAMVYPDGSKVEIAENINPYR